MNALFTPFFLAASLVALPVQAGLFDWLGLNNTEQAPARSDFLPVDQAFVLTYQQAQSVLELHFAIQPDYYLYRHTINVSANDTELGDWTLPQGTPHEDEYFGKSQVYYQQLKLEVPLKSVAKGGSVAVHYQGCTTGLCYPPQTIQIALK
ncbi:MAG: protein-disulfide reductase DsbD domain-containing protein [Oceanisphaera sp.]|uniref:protein-disulfide reductase DsbD domain-containing protein n=1 Tax=Oceanisphaera sp. TaxID=1929979 RepID=UPI003F9813B1